MALTGQQGVSLQIEKVGSDPHCEMSIDSEVKDKINMAPGTKASLSFLDCPNDDLRLTGSKVIGRTLYFFQRLLKKACLVVSKRKKKGCIITIPY